MAKVKTNAEGPVSGKIKHVVYYEMYGNNYVRAAPVTNEGTWNEEQHMRRRRISAVSTLWRVLRNEQFSRIWNGAAEKMNGYAWFVKANMPALQMDGSLIDARLLKVAEGKLFAPQKVTAERVEVDAATVRVSWQNDPHTSLVRLSDELMVVSYAGGQFSPITVTGLKRSQLSGTFALPEKPVGATHVFLFMASADRKTYSESTGCEI